MESEQARCTGEPAKSEVELLQDRIAQRDAELMDWARRYDDAVQPLQRRCSELVAALAASEQRGKDLMAQRDESYLRGGQLVDRIQSLEAQLHASERALERVREALEKAHNCSTFRLEIDEDGKVHGVCDGCLVSAVLASPGSPQEKGESG